MSRQGGKFLKIVPAIRALIRSRVDGWIASYLFRVDVRERFCRQEFFYNAFKALSFNGINGDYLEFGCNGGMTFALAHQEARRHGHPARLWAFDSFRGLPAQQGQHDAHPMWVEHSLATDLASFHDLCAANGIGRDDYEVVCGYYNHSLPALGDCDGPQDVACVFIDCDLYSSTRDVLEYLLPRLKHGMILGFDDYHCWSTQQISGERRAMLEMFATENRWNLEPFMRFGWHGQAFVVEDSTLLPARGDLTSGLGH